MENLKDFFSQIPDILKFGLLGLAVIMLFVLAYVAIKQPDRKFPIIIITIFCAFVLVFFSVSGIGLQQENRQVKNANNTLEQSKDSLIKKSDTLQREIKVADAKLKSTEILNELNKNVLPSGSIATKLTELNTQFAIIQSTSTDTAVVSSIDKVKSNFEALAFKTKEGVFTNLDKSELVKYNDEAKAIIFATQ